MIPIEYKSYYDIFSAKLKKCHSKKDYKHLCKEMIWQFDAIDHVDENKWKIFSSLIGQDTYLRGQMLAVKMYVLDQQGIPYDMVAMTDDSDIM